MPKFQLRIQGEAISVFEKRNRVRIEEMKVGAAPEGLTIQFPLKRLNNPQYILSSLKMRVHDLPVDLTSWRILRME